MKKRKNSFGSATVLFEDTGELLTPESADTRERLKVSICLLNATQAALTVIPSKKGEKRDSCSNATTLSGNKVLNSLCLCPRCQASKCALVVTILKSRKRYIYPAPVRVVLQRSCPEELRVFKDSCNPMSPGSCLVLFPLGKTPEDWYNAIQQHGACLNSTELSAEGIAQNMGIASKVTVPHGMIRIARALGGVGNSIVSSTVPIVHRVDDRDQFLTVTELMNNVVNRAMGEIPTQYALCWSGRERGCENWCVTDNAPVSLPSFVGETLYLFPRRLDLVPAIDEWMSALGACTNTNARAQLLRLTKEPSALREMMPSLLGTLIQLSDPCIQKLYDSLIPRHPAPLKMCHRLHGFDEALTVRFCDTYIQHIPVTNTTSKPVFVSVEITSQFAIDSGVEVSVSPLFLAIPEGATRDFRFSITGISPVGDKYRQACVYGLLFWTLPIDSHGKDKNPLRDVPQIIPFQYAVLPAETPQELSVLPPDALNDMTVLRDCDPVQGCPVQQVRFENITYMRKAVRLQSLPMSPNTPFGSRTPTSPASDDSFAGSVDILRAELLFMEKMRHPCILSVDCHLYDPTTDVVYLMLPFAHLPTSLNDMFIAQKSPIMMPGADGTRSSFDVPYPLRLKIALDVITGLSHLHHFGIALGDLSLDNICVTSQLFNAFQIDGSNEDVNTLLCDIGHVGSICVSRVKENAEVLPFFAPELISMNGSDAFVHLEEKTIKSDTYSFGLVLFSLLAGKRAYQSSFKTKWNTLTDLLYLVSKGELTPDLSEVSSSSVILVKLIEGCVKLNPSERPDDDRIRATIFRALSEDMVLHPNWKTASDSSHGEKNKAAAIPSPVVKTRSMRKSYSAIDDIPIPSSLSSPSRHSTSNDRSLDANSVFVPPPPPPQTESSLDIPPPSFDDSHEKSVIPPPPPESIPEAAPPPVEVPVPPPQVTVPVPSGVSPTPTETPTPEETPSTTPSLDSPNKHQRRVSLSKGTIVVKLVYPPQPRSVMVRLTSTGASVEHLMKTFSRSRVIVEDMSLAEATTMRMVDDDMLVQAFADNVKSLDVALYPSNEFVVSKVSCASEVTVAYHRSVTVGDVVSNVVRSLGLASGVVTLSGGYVLLPSDLRLSQIVGTSDSASTKEPQHISFNLCQCTEFIPICVRISRREDSCAFKALMALVAPLREIFRTALIDQYGTDDCLEALDVFSVSGEPIVDSSITLREYAMKHPLSVGKSEYEFVMRDGQILSLHYKPCHKGEERVCSLRFPPTVITLEDVRRVGCESMGLDCANVFVSTTTGIALLDTSSEVDSYHISEGLCLCDMEDMLRVTVNENFAVGFTRSSKPNAELLLKTMGMPDNVFICFDDVVLPNSTLLVPDGSYNVVELPSEDFRSVTIRLPPNPNGTNSEPQFIVLDAFVEATVGSLVRAAEDRISSSSARMDRTTKTAALVDNTDCILDFALPIYLIPVGVSELQLVFV